MIHTAGVHTQVQPVAFRDGQCAYDLVGLGSGSFVLHSHWICGEARFDKPPILKPGYCDLFGTEVGGLTDEFGLAWCRAREGIAWWNEYTYVGGHLCDNWKERSRCELSLA